jgi:hypothetical protein
MRNYLLTQTGEREMTASATEQTAALQFQAVGHYSCDGDPCVMTVVAAFIRREAAEAFISAVNDKSGAAELELFINGEPAA